MISPWTRRLAATLFALALAPAMAQDYPSKLIHIIVPYPPGGGTDTVTRLIAPKLSEALKQTVIVENRPGASTNIATEFVAKAAPDGYTLLLQAPNLTTNEAMFSKLAWSLRDFTGVIQLVRYSNVLIAGPGAKVADFKDLLAQSKANPKAFSYGTPGVGSLSHLSTELLKTRTGLAIEHIGYKGSAPISADLLGGHLPLATDNLNSQIIISAAGRSSRSSCSPRAATLRRPRSRVCPILVSKISRAAGGMASSLRRELRRRSWRG